MLIHNVLRLVRIGSRLHEVLGIRGLSEIARQEN